MINTDVISVEFNLEPWMISDNCVVGSVDGGVVMMTYVTVSSDVGVIVPVICGLNGLVRA